MTFKQLFEGNVIFVDELPECCSDCPFSSASYLYFKCLVTERAQDDYAGMKRMRGCPLRVKEK